MTASQTLDDLKRRYTEFLIQNVDTISTAESWMKTLSYIIGGRLSSTHSTVISELLYSSTNFLILFHDHLLRKHYNLQKLQSQSARWLKTALTALECVEVLLEITARRYTSLSFKWIVIVAVELIKMVGRFLLLVKYNSRLRLYPLVKRLNRKQMEASDSSDENDEQMTNAESESYYKLNHTGRQVQSVSDKYRSRHVRPDERLQATPLTKEQLFAESLHNVQPLIHLLAVGIFGEKSWLPWLTSLASDMTSLTLLNKSVGLFTADEKKEVARRKFMLLMYLVRSPCYDRYTKLRILRFLTLLSKFPGIKYIANACQSYLPEWQSTYFYTWTT